MVKFVVFHIGRIPIDYAWSSSASAFYFHTG
jgi:hypothetical protein